MGNVYVNQFQDVLKRYHSKQKELNAKIAENNICFTPEYAEKENAKVKELQEQEYEKARQSIENIYSTVRGFLADANFPSVEALTADRLFFEKNSNIDLSPEEVSAFVQRYKDNPTMLRMIQNWIENNNEPTAEHPAGKYSSIDIVLPIDMLKSYQKFGQGALSVIEKIYANGLIMQDPLEIESFADETMTGKLLNKIGTGIGLNNFMHQNIPESAKSAFDDISLGNADANYYMR